MTLLYYILQIFAIIISLYWLENNWGKIMNDFFKRNLVWVAILLCVAGIILSIIGVPAGNPIFFFIGIILSLPTIGYLIYHVFFYHEKPELNLAPTTNKISTSNITSIVTAKNDVLLKDEISEEDDLEPFYNGYANEAEITQRLHEVTNNEHKHSIIDLPELILPTAEPIGNYDKTSLIEDMTNDELLRQREFAIDNSDIFDTEIPSDLTEEEPEETIQEVSESETSKPYTFAIDNFDTLEGENREEIDLPQTNINQEFSQPINEETIESIIEDQPQDTELSLDDPNFVLPVKPVMPLVSEAPKEQLNLTPVDLTNAKIIHVDTEKLEQRKQKAQEKKILLAQPNLERYLKHYFIETAACFLMDRALYKDKNGIAPYNKFAVNKSTDLPEYSMSNTKGRLYKFCTYLIDAERFIKHPSLYNDFVTTIEQGISIARISETLHPLYRKKFKKDFVLNLSNREDWDNVIILVYNNYLLSNNNFKDVFTHLPFEIPYAYNDENIVDYLKDTDLQERFAEKYNAIEEMGVPTFWDALYICFINSVKQKLNIEQIESAILREYKKIARSLKRIDATRRKIKKAS